MTTLSNTAVPKYYGQFREKVLSGEIPVCRNIEMEMNRIDALIENPAIYYDGRAVEGVIYFCETELCLTDGSPLRLLDSFKLWLEQIFGWYYFREITVPEPNPDGFGTRYVRKRIKKRLVNKQYLIVPRGGAKSMYDSCVQSFKLVCDTRTTQQVTTAPTMKQAEEVMSPIRTALARHPGPVFTFMTAGSLQNTSGNPANRPQLASTKKGIVNYMTNSILEVRPMSIDKLQGLRSPINTVDEWLSGDTREDVVGTLEQGASKEFGAVSDGDWLIVCTSSEGTIRNGVGDDIKMELRTILKGDYYNPHVSIWWYQLDDIREVNNPDTWIKANPNLGSTVSYETYQLDVERAEKNPLVRNDILAKRFNLEMEGYTYFFRYEETLCCNKIHEYWQMPCALGVDLSLGDDFCAFTFLFPLINDEFGIRTLCFISSYTLNKLPLAMRAKYEEFIKEGSLMVLDGTVLNLDQVYDEVSRYIDANRYDVMTLGYDPWNARSFIERWEIERGPYGIEKVVQGARTESVPLGELKLLAEQRLLLFDQSLMSFAMGNCVVVTDTNNNKKLMKKRADQKIDSVAALMDAWVAYKAHKDVFQ